MFTVKEASEIMGISPHSLRFYDKEGLLPTLSRTESGRRMFSYEDLEWVYNIQCWRLTGMPLAEIRRYIELIREGEGTLEERFAIILKQRDRAIEEARAAKERVKMLQYKVNWYEALRQGEDPNKWRPNIQAIVRKAQAQRKEGTAKSSTGSAPIAETLAKAGKTRKTSKTGEAASGKALGTARRKKAV